MQLQRPTTLALGVSLALLTSCASVTVKPTDTPDEGSGIVYYEPRPHVSISESVKDGATNRSVAIIMLPDRDRARRVTWSAGLFGVASPKVSLTDGWMFGGIEASITQGLSEVLKTVVDAAAFDGTPISPGIYPLVWTGSDPGHWHIDQANPVL